MEELSPMEEFKKTIEERWPRLVPYVEYTNDAARLPLYSGYCKFEHCLSHVDGDPYHSLMCEGHNLLHGYLGETDFDTFLCKIRIHFSISNAKFPTAKKIFDMHKNQTATIRESALPLPIRDAILEQF